MPKETITCIVCPAGCQMEVAVENGKVESVKGNACKRGEAYACQECISPTRMVTAVASVSGSEMPVSMKTAFPIPKAKINDVMRAVDGLRVSAPVLAGQILIPDIAGTGIAMIATKDVL